MGGVTYLLVAQCPSIVPIVVIYAKTVNVAVWVPGVITGRSYWIPGSYASALSEKRNAFCKALEK